MEKFNELYNEIESDEDSDKTISTEELEDFLVNKKKTKNLTQENLKSLKCEIKEMDVNDKRLNDLKEDVEYLYNKDLYDGNIDNKILKKLADLFDINTTKETKTKIKIMYDSWSKMDNGTKTFSDFQEKLNKLGGREKANLILITSIYHYFDIFNDTNKKIPIIVNGETILLEDKDELTQYLPDILYGDDFQENRNGYLEIFKEFANEKNIISEIDTNSNPKTITGKLKKLLFGKDLKYTIKQGGSYGFRISSECWQAMNILGYDNIYFPKKMKKYKNPVSFNPENIKISKEFEEERRKQDKKINELKVNKDFETENKSDFFDNDFGGLEVNNRLGKKTNSFNEKSSNNIQAAIKLKNKEKAENKLTVGDIEGQFGYFGETGYITTGPSIGNLEDITIDIEGQAKITTMRQNISKRGIGQISSGTQIMTVRSKKYGYLQPNPNSMKFYDNNGNELTTKVNIKKKIRYDNKSGSFIFGKNIKFKNGGKVAYMAYDLYQSDLEDKKLEGQKEIKKIEDPGKGWSGFLGSKIKKLKEQIDEKTITNKHIVFYLAELIKKNYYYAPTNIDLFNSLSFN